MPRHNTLDPEFLTSEVRRIATKWWRRARQVEYRVATLEPKGKRCGNVLFSYILDPFLLPPGVAVPYSHTHFWESATMAQTFQELGFRVDAISWTNQRFVPQRPYDFLIDVRLNLERLAPLLDGATKVLHIDTAHHSFHNPAQERRLKELAARRGVTIASQKMLPRNHAIERADLATVLGNEFTQQTYAFAGKPQFRIPISVPFTYPWPQGKNFDAVRRRFLWFGSGGLVHKGLDLVLEAFAAMPTFHLTVCGPIRREKDFERAYFRELYETPNIDTVGWVDVGSPRFREVADGCVALVYPSCSEGGGGSALTCMHAGLIPLVNHEVSIDLPAAQGASLPGCSISQIQESVRELSERPATELQDLARVGWEFARKNHTKDTFRAGYRRFAQSLVEGRWQRTGEAMSGGVDVGVDVGVEDLAEGPGLGADDG
jgi:glycosyltransferase involved in cell wall biosynthesis